MARLSTHGGFDEELLAKAKEEMRGELEFAEQEEPLARNGSGYPSVGGFIEQHFDFSTCQRSDGSYYGTGGTCRKGSPVSGGVPKDSKKSKSAASGSGGGGATLDAASRKEYGNQAKQERQSAKDIKRDIKRNGSSPDLEKKLKQTEARAEKFERMAKTGVFESPKKAKSSPKSTNTAGITLRDAQKQGLTTGRSKNPNWK